MRIMKIFKETISDGPGFRYSIYFSGCSHYCKGCHNPETWKGETGELVDTEYMDNIVSEIRNNPLLDGITLSGGDPFFKPSELLEFLRDLKKRVNLGVWAYTGYRFEELLEDEIMKECLQYIEVIIDGKFEEKNFNPELYYRGSSNQRIVDVQASLESNKVITRDYD